MSRRNLRSQHDEIPMFEYKTLLEQREMINEKGKLFLPDKELRRKLPVIAMLNSWRETIRTTIKGNMKLPLLECVLEKPPVPTEENLKETKNEQYIRALLMKNSPCSPVSEETRKHFEPLKNTEKAPAINMIVRLEIKRMMKTGQLPSHLTSIIAQIEAQQKKDEENEPTSAVIGNPKPVKMGQKAKESNNSDPSKVLGTIKEDIGQDNKTKRSKLIENRPDSNSISEQSTNEKSGTELVEIMLHQLVISKTSKAKVTRKEKRAKATKNPVAGKIPGKKSQQRKQSDVFVANNPIKINSKTLKTENEETKLTYRRSERVKKLVEREKPGHRVAVENNDSIQKANVKREKIHIKIMFAVEEFEKRTSVQQRRMLKKKDTKMDEDEDELRPKYSQSEKFSRSVMLNNWRSRLHSEIVDDEQLPLVKCLQEKSDLPAPSSTRLNKEQIARLALLRNLPSISEEARKQFIPIRDKKWIPEINEMVISEMGKMAQTRQIPSHLVPFISRIEEQTLKEAAIAKAAASVKAKAAAIAKEEADNEKLRKKLEKMNLKEGKRTKSAKITGDVQITNAVGEKSEQNPTKQPNPIKCSLNCPPTEFSRNEVDKTKTMLRRSPRFHGKDKQNFESN
ncbi:unnamed protein product [Caenorhabditis brenneri]